MKRSRFSGEQTISILREHEAAQTADLCHNTGISSAAFYAWKAKFGGYGSLRGEAAEGA